MPPPDPAPHDPGGKTRLRLNADTVSEAAFSPCRRYRWWLERRWDGRPIGSGDVAAFIGMNPSVADIDIDDPTVAGCGRRARLWGFSGFVMLNAFGYRATDKSRLLEIADPVGPDNDAALLRQSQAAARVIVAWGQPPKPLQHRGPTIARLLAKAHIRPMCFAMNRDGSPKHPLYVRTDAPVIPWAG